MELQMLERFFHMNDLEVSTEYHFVVTKPIFKGGDYDQRLIIILDSINSKERTFSDFELTIISTIVKLRKSKNYIEFINVYPVLKETMFQTFDRQNNLSTIRSLLTNGTSISSSFDFNSSNSPCMKSSRSNICVSPSCIDSIDIEEPVLSSSFKVEVVFGCRYDIGEETKN